MVFETWETGETSMQAMKEFRGWLVRRNANNQSICGSFGLCFCGPVVCKAQQGWVQLPPVKLGRRLVEAKAEVSRPLPSFSTAHPRSLQFTDQYLKPNEWTVAKNTRAHINVVFGIEVTPGAPL